MDILPHPFLLNYTNAVLTEAAESIGIDILSRDNKGQIIYKLNCHHDTEEMTNAVHEAAGE